MCVVLVLCCLCLVPPCFISTSQHILLPVPVRPFLGVPAFYVSENKAGRLIGQDSSTMRKTPSPLLYHHSLQQAGHHKVPGSFLPAPCLTSAFPHPSPLLPYFTIVLCPITYIPPLVLYLDIQWCPRLFLPCRHGDNSGNSNAAQADAWLHAWRFKLCGGDKMEDSGKGKKTGGREEGLRHFMFENMWACLAVLGSL